MDPHAPLVKNSHPGNTASTTAATQGEYLEDLYPLPRRLKDVAKDRVILIRKESAICENVGIAELDITRLNRGRYRLYFMRIENEQRIMH
jgi:hypothetical protein